METAQVNSLPTESIYLLGNNTGDNVAAQAQIEPPKVRKIDWDELGVELDDLELIADIIR